MPGEAGGHEGGIAVADVEEDVVAVGALHLGDDGAGDDVPGGELGVWVVVGHEAAAVAGEELRAFAAQGLGDEEGARAGEGQCGGVELDEFHIADHGAGLEGEGDAVPGREGRVGGQGVELAAAAGGENGPGCGDGALLVGGGAGVHAAAAALLDE